MGHCWDAAVAAAGEEPPPDLPAAVAEELIALWSDLGEAMRRAGSRSWSVECDGLVVRIVMLSRAHRGDVVAVDTGAAAGQRRLSGHPAVGRHRVRRAVRGRGPGLERRRQARDSRAAMDQPQSLSVIGAPVRSASRSAEYLLRQACRAHGWTACRLPGSGRAWPGRAIAPDVGEPDRAAQLRGPERARGVADRRLTLLAVLVICAGGELPHDAGPPPLRIARGTARLGPGRGQPDVSRHGAVVHRAGRRRRASLATSA